MYTDFLYVDKCPCHTFVRRIFSSLRGCLATQHELNSATHFLFQNDFMSKLNYREVLNVIY